MRILILSVAALVGLSAAAFADEAATGKGRHHGRAREKFARLDTDKDGKLSQAEVSGHPKLAQKFAEIDKNGDGFLTPEEIRAYAQAHRGEHRGGGDKPAKPT